MNRDHPAALRTWARRELAAFVVDPSRRRHARQSTARRFGGEAHSTAKLDWAPPALLRSWGFSGILALADSTVTYNTVTNNLDGINLGPRSLVTYNTANDNRRDGILVRERSTRELRHRG